MIHSQPSRCAASLWNNNAGCSRIPPPVRVLAPGDSLTVGCTVVVDGPDRMLSSHFTGGCSSTRRGTSPLTRPWAPSSAKWKAWATPTSTEARGFGTSPITSSPPRSVGRWVGLFRSARACRLDLNVECICHTTPNWSVLCLPSAASHSYRWWRDCGESGSDQTSTKPWIKLSARINISLTQAAMMERLCFQDEEVPYGPTVGHQAHLTWSEASSDNLTRMHWLAKSQAITHSS